MTSDITLILIITAIVIFSPFIAKLLRVPTTPVEIILGSIAGYYHLIDHSNTLFTSVAEFGFLFLMFIAGTEVHIKKITHLDKKNLRRSFFYIAILYVLSFLFVYYLDFSDIFILILPLISIGLVASIAKELGSDMEWIQLSFIVGTLGEVVSIVLLTIASAMIQFGVGLELLRAILYLVGFSITILIAYRLIHILFWWYPEIRTLLMPHSDNQEQDIRLSISLLFIFMAIMLILELELAFGAFIAGIFIANFFSHKEELPEKLSSFGFGFIIPIFFIHIGTTFNLNALAWDGLLVLGFVIANVMILMRVMAAFVFYSTLGFRGTFLFALSHAMPLTLLIAVATLAHHSHSIDEFHYFAFILGALFEVIFSMIAIKILSHVKFLQGE